jgi:arylsulfatase A-like enzyme
MFAAMPLSSRQDLPGVILRDPPIAALTFELLRRAGDFDGDGHSAWFGGRDCAPFDPDRSPFARERVGNGIDEDCSGADLRAQEFDPPPVRPSSTTRPPSSAHPDIVVVMVDTVRARELALHGGPVQTPVLDALARQSAVFDRFYALCPSTHRAMPSLLTGMLPSSLEETLAGPQAISDARTTVFEALADQGYTSNVVFGQKFMRERNLDQGVAAVHDNPHVRGHHVDPVRTRLALGLLEQWDTAPQLLWVHYYAPHAPHVAPRGHDAGDGSEQAAYAAEIQAFDTELGRLLDALRATPRGRAAWVVVTSDHGEEFYEHGYTLHARALYEESVHVPLVVHAPGFDPSRVTTPVDQLDLGTTLAAIGGARLGHGRDLRPALRGAAVPERPVLLELYPMRENTLTAVAIVDGDHKLILDLKQGLFEHFDLRNDPGEHTNRYDDAPQSAQPLRHALLRHLERAHAIR